MSHGSRQRPDATLYRLSRFSAPYQSRLLAGLKDLQAFCERRHHLTLSSVASKRRIADAVLGDYVISKDPATDKKCLSLVKHALLGFQHVFPHLRGKLGTCWENLKVAEEQRVTKLRAPLPVPLWLFMVGLARAHAKVAGDQPTASVWKIFSVLLEIGLFCMLRPGELLKLRHADVCLPGSFTLCQNHAALRVMSPKNRRQFGEHQFVLVKHSNTVEWLRLIHKPRDSGLIWPRKKHIFAKMFKQLTLELGARLVDLPPVVWDQAEPPCITIMECR